jgi:IclR family KDG regulon transcriptional repressor
LGNVRKENMRQKEDRYRIRALDRAIGVLSALSDGKPRTLAELSEAITLSSSTTYRLITTLAYHNYIERDEPTGKYTLGFACLELARSYQIHNHIRKVALPELEALRDQTKETIHLAILDNMEVVYLEKLHGLHAIGLMSSQVGGRALAYCTGLGKVLLAYSNLEQVRAHFEHVTFTRYTDTTITTLDELIRHLDLVHRQGYAVDTGEHEPDVRCVAAPIFDLSGRAVAAISIAGPTSRMEPPETAQEHIDKILRATAAISKQLGYRQT